MNLILAVALVDANRVGGGAVVGLVRDQALNFVGEGMHLAGGVYADQENPNVKLLTRVLKLIGQEYYELTAK